MGQKAPVDVNIGESSVEIVKKFGTNYYVVIFIDFIFVAYVEGRDEADRGVPHPALTQVTSFLIHASIRKRLLPDVNPQNSTVNFICFRF